MRGKNGIGLNLESDMGYKNRFINNGEAVFFAIFPRMAKCDTIGALSKNYRKFYNRKGKQFDAKGVCDFALGSFQRVLCMCDLFSSVGEQAE